MTESPTTGPATGLAAGLADGTPATAGSRWVPPACCGPSTRPTVLGVADVHVATRLGALLEEPDEQVLLAAALAVRAVRAGSVCLDLRTVARPPAETLTRDGEPLPWPEATGWIDAVGRSPLVREEMLRLVGPRLYLDRYWREEGQVCDDLVDRIRRSSPEVDEPRARRGPAPRLPARRVRGAAQRCPPGGLPLDDRADRWPRHRQDDHRGRTARPGLRAARARHRPPPADRAGGPDGQGRGAAPGSGPGGGRVGHRDPAGRG